MGILESKQKQLEELSQEYEELKIQIEEKGLDDKNSQELEI